MSDKYINQTGLSYYHGRIKNIFASQNALQLLSDEVDQIIAEGGEPNIIEEVQRNGVALPITSKAVNVSVPTATSEITNDGDGSSLFATEDYVEQHGGKIDTISVNGTDQPITNKKVNIAVPTKTSDITNDSDYQNETEVQALIDASLEGITGIDFQVVTELPTTGQHGVIYLVHKSGTASDIYDEYIWVTPSGGTADYEQIGTTEVDLTDYWGKTELVAMTTAEIDNILNA